MTDYRTIEAPTHCPSCGSVLTWQNDILYCMNESCYAKSSKRIEHFVKTLKIKGLGPATIQKLNLQSIEEIYQLDLVTIVEDLGSQKLGEKLFVEIKNSERAPLDDLLPAFGIPLVGETASKKLCKVISTIEEINAETCKEAGLGPKVTENITAWWLTFQNNYKNLPFDYGIRKRSSKEQVGIVCISGKLKTVKSKADATKLLEQAGYQVKDNLTKDVTILINESGVESAKTKKAKETGILIVTNLKDFLGENNEQDSTKMD